MGSEPYTAIKITVDNKKKWHKILNEISVVFEYFYHLQTFGCSMGYVLVFVGRRGNENRSDNAV